MCDDNAKVESFWSRLKTEVLEWPVFIDLADVQACIADYFNYYNHERLHSSIGFRPRSRSSTITSTNYPKLPSVTRPSQSGVACWPNIRHLPRRRLAQGLQTLPVRVD